MFFESYAVVLWNATQRKKEAAQRDIVKNTSGEVFFLAWRYCGQWEYYWDKQNQG